MTLPHGGKALENGSASRRHFPGQTTEDRIYHERSTHVHEIAAICQTPPTSLTQRLRILPLVDTLKPLGEVIEVQNRSSMRQTTFNCCNWKPVEKLPNVSRKGSPSLTRRMSIDRLRPAHAPACQGNGSFYPKGFACIAGRRIVCLCGWRRGEAQ